MSKGIKPRRASILRAQCCKHDKVTLALLDANHAAFATASLDYVVFLDIVAKIVADHDAGGFNCGEEAKH